MTFAIASFAFILSGFAALIYQIAWQRLLVLPIGADVYSTTIIVTAFMAGLGIGSVAGGHVADRLNPRRNLFMFVGAELAVGAFGLASRWVFYDVLYLRLSSETIAPSALAVVMFAALVWPTFWMGMSLPLLARAVSTAVADAAHRVGGLYALNTVGAAAGAFASTWVLLPNLGVDGTLRLAALLNIAAGIIALALAWTTGRGHDVPQHTRAGQTAPAIAQHPEAPRWRFRTWAILYALAGFQALSLEILWFRLLGVTLKSSAFTLGTLLTIYLTGLALGAALESLVLRRVRRLDIAFLGLQAFISLYAVLSVSVLYRQLQSGRTFAGLGAYVSGYEPLDPAAAFNRLWQSGGSNPD
jgi:spermidine synthase